MASVFGNSVSMPIVALGLSGHCNSYRATVAVICNINILRHQLTFLIFYTKGNKVTEYRGKFYPAAIVLV